MKQACVYKYIALPIRLNISVFAGAPGANSVHPYNSKRSRIEFRGSVRVASDIASDKPQTTNARQANSMYLYIP